MVALACDHIVMHDTAELGGDGAVVLEPPDIRDSRRAVQQRMIAKGRSWSLPMALIDPSLEVAQYSRLGVTDYFCEEEWRSLPSRAKWQKGPVITRPGQPLKLSGKEALEDRVANFTVADFRELKEHYGLQDDPHLLEPSWAHTLIGALAHPGAAALLLLIGFVGLYFELHAPGTGIGAFVGTVSFMLFFWSRFLGGTAGWLEVLLFLMGLACLALEVFVLPGMGIFGLGGGGRSCWPRWSWPARPAGCFRGTPTSWPNSNSRCGCWAGRWWGPLWSLRWHAAGCPARPIFNKMLLQPPTNEEADSIAQQETLLEAAHLIGARGVTTTPLMPGGKARFDGRVLDVLAEGQAIGRGVAVVVVEVQGNRVVVEPVRD